MLVIRDLKENHQLDARAMADIHAGQGSIMKAVLKGILKAIAEYQPPPAYEQDLDENPSSVGNIYVD